MTPDPAQKRFWEIPGILASWRADERGTSAVEFALIAPMMFFGLLSMVDLGLAVSERMSIDHVLRSAAQTALTDPGESVVLEFLNTTAENGFTLSTNNIPAVSDPLTVSVLRFCACPESPAAAVSCTTACDQNEPTYIFYRLSAEKDYDGVILPVISAQPSIQVQVR